MEFIQSFIVLMTLFNILIYKGLTSSEKMFVCYFTNWAKYRQGEGKYGVANIDTNLCTHLVFAFSKVSDTQLQPHDLSDHILPGGTWQRFNYLKQINPKLKTLLAVGGWNHGPEPFTRMVATYTSRMIFIKNAIDLLRKYQFDGFDIDWEYPGKYEPSDKAQLTLFLRELRERVNEESQRTKRPPLLLTAAVAAGISIAEKAYDVPVLMQTLDYISVMTFDYHGDWEKVTGHNAPLRGQNGDELNIISTLDWYLSQGARKEKLVVALPAYARSWTLADPDNTSIGAKALYGGRKGRWTQSTGTLSNYEVCDMQKLGMTTTYDNLASSVYGVLGDQWVTYENENTITNKVDYITSEGYAGVMVWALDHDDFTGKHCGRGINPLLNTISRRLSETLITSTEKPTTAKPTGPTTTVQTIITAPTTAPSTAPTRVPTTAETTAPTMAPTTATTKAPTMAQTTTTTTTTTTTATIPVTTTLKKIMTTEMATRTEPNKTFNCPKQYGKFQHPTFCSKYYSCFGWMHFEESCISASNFNPSLERCDENYTCP